MNLRRLYDPWTAVVFDPNPAPPTPPPATPPAAPPPPTPPATPPAPAPPPAAAEKPDDAAFARIRRENAALEAEAKRLRDEAAERERKEAEEQGRWKELAEQEKARADRLEADRAAERAKANAAKAAGELKFADPDYALYRLAQDGVSLEDPAAVKAALENLAQSAPSMLQGTAPPPPPPPPPPSGAPITPGPAAPGGPTLTAAQLAEMSPTAIAKLDPAVVNAAMKAGAKQ